MIADPADAAGGGASRRARFSLTAVTSARSGASRRSSDHGRRSSVSAGGQTLIPGTHHAGMTEHGPGKLQSHPAWICSCGDRPNPRGTRLGSRPSAWLREEGSRRRNLPAPGGRSRRTPPFRVVGHRGDQQPTATSWASMALRMMKSSDGGSAGKPEKRFTARSNDPHHVLTGVDRPR